MAHCFLLRPPASHNRSHTAVTHRLAKCETMGFFFLVSFFTEKAGAGLTQKVLRKEDEERNSSESETLRQLGLYDQLSVRSD